LTAWTRGCARVLAFIALPIRLAAAGPDECRDATDQYTLALSVLADAIQVYGGCVAESNGRDDCSIEFSRLQLAQDNFLAAVSDYQSECG
jgi:hypothetical protein